MKFIFNYAAVFTVLFLFTAGCVKVDISHVSYTDSDLRALEKDNKFDLLIKHFETVKDISEINRAEKLSIIFTYKVPDFSKAIQYNKFLLVQSNKHSIVYSDAAERLVYIYKKLGSTADVDLYLGLVKKHRSPLKSIAEEAYKKTTADSGVSYYGVMAALVQINNSMTLLGSDRDSQKLFGQYTAALKSMSAQRTLGDVDSLVLSQYMLSIGCFRDGTEAQGVRLAEEFLRSAAQRDTLLEQENKKRRDLKSLEQTVSAQKRLLGAMAFLEGDTVSVLSIMAVAELASGGHFFVRPLLQQAQIERLKFTSQFAVGVSRYLSLEEQVEFFLYLASGYKHQNQDDEAIIWFQAALKTLESVRSTLVLEQHRMGYFRNLDAIYSELVSLLIKQNRYEEAFVASERLRSRALLDMMSTKPIRLPEAEKELYDNFVAYDAEVSAILDDKNLSLESAAAFQGRQRGISLVATSTITPQEQERAATKIEHLVSTDVISHASLAKLLGQDAVLVEMFYTTEKTFLFVVTNKAIKVVTVDVSSHDLEQLTTAYLSRLAKGGADLVSAQKLYKILVAPIADEIRGKHVVFAPYGELHSLPMATLHDGTRYLVDSLSSSYTYSATLLPYTMQNRSFSNDRALVIGDPKTPGNWVTLPYARAEAVAVGSMLPQADVVLGSQATESLFKRRVSGARFIHVASHAYFDAKAPMRSSILFSADRENDGYLTADETFALDLSQTEILVLSACETGLGEITTGDESLGLTRGLLYSGAATIISTLWSIEDQTAADLMKQFYRRQPSIGRARALQAAQKDIALNMPPYFWGAFKVSGDWR